MSLQAKLDAIRDSFEGSAPQEALDVMHGSTNALIEAGLADRATQAGDVAPAFSLPDSDGNSVTLGQLLAEGPLVLSFFRGHW